MNLLILFGGSSFEHEISIVSAITLKKVLGHAAGSFVFLDPHREFYLIDPAKMKSDTFSSGAYKKEKKLSLRSGGFVQEGIFGSKTVACDAVLNLVHGRDGEDGKLAALLSFYAVPFVGPRLEASVMSYNKRFTKMFAQSLGIEVLPYSVLHRGESPKVEPDFPVIVKPVHLGSSIGVSVVRSREELDYALDVAFEFDDEVLIEPFVEGIREYNLAGCRTEAWELSLVEEPHKEEFLDFDKKYLDFGRDDRVQEAVIDASLKDRLENAFKKIYDPLFSGSVIRCDFFVHDDRILLNEINPIPGSMAHYLFDDFQSMLQRLIRHLPREPEIAIDYQYIGSIQKAKGKA